MFDNRDIQKASVKKVRKLRRVNTQGRCVLCDQNDIMSISYFDCGCVTSDDQKSCAVKFKTLKCRGSDAFEIYSNSHSHMENIKVGTIVTVSPEMEERVNLLSHLGPQAILLKLRAQLGKKAVLSSETWLKNYLYKYRKINGKSNSYDDLIAQLGKYLSYIIIELLKFKPELDELDPFLVYPDIVNGKIIVGLGEDDDPLLFTMTSKRLLSTLRITIGNCLYAGETLMLHVDATHKVTLNGYPLIIVGLSDKNGHFHLISISVSSHQNEDAYAKCLRDIKRLALELFGFDLNPNFIMADGDKAISNACLQVFSKRTLMCFFHLQFNVRKKLRKLNDDEKEEILNDIRYIYYVFLKTMD